MLTAIVEVFESTGRAMRPNEIVEQSGLDADQVEAALRALEGEDPPFISKLERRSSGGISLVGRPTGHARRAVGAWPTPESIADRLVSALDEAADREPDPSGRGGSVRAPPTSAMPAATSRWRSERPRSTGRWGCDRGGRLKLLVCRLKIHSRSVDLSHAVSYSRVILKIARR